MSTKVQPVSGMEHTIETAVTATASVSSTPSPKVSMFAKKSGFVIPKNKLSGSLVPVFRGSKKPGSTDVKSEESTKQALRKTKWGPDLTQDAFVRKGRALAYQTRLDQITQQLKSGIMEARYDQDSPVAHGADQESLDHQNIEKSELLEQERREVIGEILKLNPSYKAPADYKPLLKEAKVPIPIKEYPGHNFIGLIFGPASDTQKRLEKETGAKIRVFGTKADTKKESEITSSDGNEAHGGYEELYVLVTAETYEKVDAAVSLIELLVTPVLANTTTAVSGDNPGAVSHGQDPPPSYTTPPVVINQGTAQPFTGPGQAPPLARFQPYPSQWVLTVQSSGFITPPFQVSSTPLNSRAVPPSFGPRLVMSGGFGSVPTQPQRPQVPNMGYAGPPRNPSLPPNFSAPPPFTPNPPNQNVRPIGSLMPQSGWSQPPAGSPGALGPTMPQIMQPMNRPQPPLTMAPTSGGQQPSPFRPPVGSQTIAPNPVPSSWFPSSTTPTSVPPPPLTALRPQQPSSNDFTFQTHRAQAPNSQQVPRPQLQPPQSPSFRPAPPVMQGFLRPNSHQMGQSIMPGPPARQPVFPGHGPQMGPRQFGPGSPASPFPPRPGPFVQVAQNHPSMGFRPQNFLAPTNQQLRGNVSYAPGRPGSNPSGPQQIYDPFSPTVAPYKPGNPLNSRKQDSDPEYDDLMASVGVK